MTEPVNQADLLSPLRMATALSDGAWQPAPHLAVIDYEFRNLIDPNNVDGPDVTIICSPPRHGKSEYLSRWAPSWFLLNYPYKSTILASHTSDLSVNNSRWCRNKVHELSPMFGLKGVDPKHASNKDWSLADYGGGMVSAGVGGNLTGRGGELIVIDDFLKSADHAMSPTIRQNQWDWFQTVSLTRRNPGGKILILATPWHRDDLIGRLTGTEYRHGLKVRLVRLQAIREEAIPDPLNREAGEALWPAQWPVSELRKMRRTMDMHWWAAMYQGRPGTHGRTRWPDEYFTDRIWVQPDEWPDKMELGAMALDPSLGKDQKNGDYQASVYAGYARRKVWIDSHLGRNPIGTMISHFIKLGMLHEPDLIGIESNGFQSVLEDPFDAACQHYRFNAELSLLNNSLRKDLRIERLGPWLENDELRFLDTPSNRILVDQLREFPTHKFDDGADAAEMAVRLMCQASSDMQHRAEMGTIQLSTGVA